MGIEERLDEIRAQWDQFGELTMVDSVWLMHQVSALNERAEAAERQRDEIVELLNPGKPICKCERYCTCGDTAKAEAMGWWHRREVIYKAARAIAGAKP